MGGEAEGESDPLMHFLDNELFVLFERLLVFGHGSEDDGGVSLPSALPSLLDFGYSHPVEPLKSVSYCLAADNIVNEPPIRPGASECPEVNGD